MLQTHIQKLPDRIISNERGQSAVEYIVICTALVTLFIMTSTQNSVYNMISHTIHDKYSSYAFGISIADPPSKAFDDKVKKDATKVKEVLNKFKDLEDFIANLDLSDIATDTLPSEDKAIIEGFEKLIQDIKDWL